jgi:hypothetical protein
MEGGDTAANQMAEVVTADVTVAINVSDVITGNSLSSGGLQLGYGETAKILYNATSPNTSLGKQWSGLLTPAVSTPTTLDLTALPGPGGTTVTFASVVFIYVYNTGGFPIGMGNAGSNPFTPGWSEATHVETIATNSRWFKEDNGTAYVVDSTHKNLMFDPSTHVGSIRVILCGN